MALDVDQNKIISLIGHDGSDIIHPDLEEPFKRRSFHYQELVDATIELGYWVMPIEFNPLSLVKPGLPLFEVYSKDQRFRRFSKYLNTFNSCVIAGELINGTPHAVAWDGLQCFCPSGQPFTIKNIKPSVLFAIDKP